MQITRGKIESAQKVVIYGPEGIGKSTFASRFPNPLFIDTEGSTKMLDVARLPAPTSWPMLLAEVGEVARDPSVCGTLVLDTADWAEMMCTTYICDKAQKQGIEDFGYGKGYIYVAEEFGKLLNKLEEVIQRGVNVVVTAHAKMRKFEQPDEMGAYDRWEMKLGKSTGPLLKEWADMVLFANYKTIVVKTEDKKTKAQGGRRIMYTTHHPCWDAKNRHGLPEELPFDYNEIAAHIKSGATASVPAPKKENAQPTVAVPVPAAEAEIPLKQEPIATAQDNTAPPPAVTAAPEPATGENPFGEQITPGIPQALADLMRMNKVLPSEIEMAVADKGYFPAGMSLTDYPSDFINGVLIGAWDQVFKFIQEDRKKVPF